MVAGWESHLGVSELLVIADLMAQIRPCQRRRQSPTLFPVHPVTRTGRKIKKNSLPREKLCCLRVANGVQHQQQQQQQQQ